jgi:hypothetical protein
MIKVPLDLFEEAFVKTGLFYGSVLLNSHQRQCGIETAADRQLPLSPNADIEHQSESASVFVTDNSVGLI